MAIRVLRQELTVLLGPQRATDEGLRSAVVVSQRELVRFATPGPLLEARRLE